jgi:hypothetical protein
VRGEARDTERRRKHKRMKEDMLKGRMLWNESMTGTKVEKAVVLLLDRS